MDYEEADLLPPGEDGPGPDEAEIVRDFSELEEEPGPSSRKRIVRTIGAIVLVLLAVVFYRGCSTPENTPDSELSSTKSEGPANLKQARVALGRMAPEPGSSAEKIAIDLETRAGVPVGVGSANEPGEVGVKVRGDKVILEIDTGSGRRFASYKMK